MTHQLPSVVGTDCNLGVHGEATHVMSILTSSCFMYAFLRARERWADSRRFCFMRSVGSSIRSAMDCTNSVRRCCESKADRQGQHGPGSQRSPRARTAWRSCSPATACRRARSDLRLQGLLLLLRELPALHTLRTASRA